MYKEMQGELFLCTIFTYSVFIYIIIIYQEGVFKLRKLRNKIIILLLLFTLILFLTACTGGDSKAKKASQVKEVAQAKQATGSKNSKELYYKLSKEQKKKVHLVVTVIREDVDSGEKRVTRIEKYDKQDRLLSEIDKNEKGKVTSYEKYEYDDEGRLIKKADTILFMGDKIDVIKTYSYNKDGKKTGYLIKSTDRGTKLGKGIYKYHKNGNLKYKYTNDVLNGRTKKFYYNKKGEKTKAIDDVDGIFELHAVSHFKREYDGQGRKIKETEIREIDGQFGKKTAEIITYYNKFGKSKKYIERVNGEIDTWFEWEYDKNGNRIKFISKDRKGNINNLKKYLFDKKIIILRRHIWIYLKMEFKEKVFGLKENIIVKVI
ncbi:YD repeat-containing protein [Candidatus Frackibacter sp. WG13]|nr:YD repeat-containing protein [Candidatus Frackibacter sp. WG11]SFL84274.1 YD repeat-containing protein [Candidatus Frackibacter sp. WG13]